MPLVHPPTVQANIRRLGCPIDGYTMDFLVREDGTPQSAEFSHECRASFGLQSISGRTDYAFSEFGGPITIRMPARFRNN